MFKSALHDLHIQICHLILGAALPTFLGSATAYARQMQCLHRAQPAIGIPAAARQWVTGLVLKQLSRCAKWDDGSGSVNAAPEGQLRVDSVEKVGLSKLPDHSLVKTPFLHAAT